MVDIALNGFDPNQYEERREGGQLLPAGNYEVTLADAERTPAKSGNGDRLVLKFSIISGEYSGSALYDGLNLWNNNATASKIAQEALADLCKAMGHYQTVANLSEIVGKSCIAKVVQKRRDDKPDEFSNEIKKYEPLGSLPTGNEQQVRNQMSAGAGAQGAMPNQGTAPAQQQSTPAHQPNGTARGPWAG